jgi:hypothetical protein
MSQVLLIYKQKHTNRYKQMKKYNYLLGLALLLLFTQARVMAQSDYKFHTVFIYNFTKYIQWPEGSTGSSFVIGVVGNSGITEALQGMAASKKVNGKPIEIKVFASAAEVANCQMVYLPDSKSGDLEELRAKLASKPTLIITEKTGLAKKGSDINFVMEGGRWKFEINQAAADMHKLKISQELTKFAVKIYDQV